MTSWEYLTGISLRWLTIPVMIIPAGLIDGNAMEHRGRYCP